MKITANKVLILSYQQLLLLLFKREIEGLILPEEIAEQTLQDRETKEAFGNLICDRYVAADESGTYRISKELDEILEVLGGATHAFVIREVHRKFLPCFLYRHEGKAVSLATDRNKKGFVKLELVSFEDRIRELLEYPMAQIIAERFEANQNEPEKTIVTDGKEKEDVIKELLEA